MARVTREESRLFTGLEVGERKSIATGADVSLYQDMPQTPDAPTVSKMDSTNGGNKSMLFMKWLVKQVYSYALLTFGAFILTLVLIVAFAGVAFGWQAGSILANLIFGG